MKMPPTPLDNAMFAPCGMNCTVCYKHCYHKKPCAGCLHSDHGKPEHCRNCKIKHCAASRQLSYCYLCPDFPCKLLRALEKSYQTRYGVSLVANSLFVKEHGLTAFMEQQKTDFTCPNCGGIISLHDGVCSECSLPVSKPEPQS